MASKGTNWTGVQKILIANRGECSCRVIRTCKKLGVHCVAIYAPDDSHSLHVRQASESRPVSSYLSQDEIIRIAKQVKADSIHPGYGFLSENPAFARKCTSAGLIWLGPSPDVMESFSSKTGARRIAETVGVPCPPASPALLNEDEAIEWASKIGYPVLLKPSGGGGGIGMQVCKSYKDIKNTFSHTRAVTERFFADPSVFVEKYVPKGRHIEIQVFGDGEGTVLHFGERECSSQRRFQKLIEETPSTALTPELRLKICSLAVKLCEYVKYESAGTVEFIFDEETKEFFFLEVNTRIQVEHGVTEMVARDGLDLVEWMIRQGHPSTKVDLKNFKWVSIGSAIELRVYAEDPIKDFQPSPGILGEFVLPVEEKGVRFDTWAFRGCNILPSYDPLIVKIIQWGPTRSEAIRRLKRTLGKTSIKGTPNNLLFLEQVIDSKDFIRGRTYTTTLDSFRFRPECFEVLKPGMKLTIQDYPGRTRRGLWRIGVSPSGPFDHLASRLANSLVGNPEDAAALEVTMKGPTLKFYTDTVVAVAGAPFKVTINGVRAPQFKSLRLTYGDTLAVDHLTSEQGLRCYIAIRGAIDVPLYLGSRSTFVKGGFGGYQGRELCAGDVIPIGPQPSEERFVSRSLDRSLWPRYTNQWMIGVLPGPMANPDYMTDEDIRMLHDTNWEVHHNSNRLGIRLTGPSPKWTRSDGGEGGSHPSNIHDCAYAIGTINFTGDMPIIIAHDGPSLGGFVCPITCALSELWKIGQVKAGDTIQFRLMSMEEAISARVAQNYLIDKLSVADSDPQLHPAVAAVSGVDTPVVLVDKKADGDHPGMQIRLAGDSYILVEYGPMTLDIRLRIRVHFLEEKLLTEDPVGLEETAPGVRSLLIRYDPLILPLPDLIDLVLSLDGCIADISSYSIRTRVFSLPLAWNSSGVREALSLYMRSVRPEAPYLPSNIEFIAKNNGVTVEEVYEKVHRASYLCLGLGDVYLGACCAVPVDPRDRLIHPKFNPARTFTQEGTVGLGGAYMCIYPMNSPGGYQLVGRTLPIWNTWGSNPNVFSAEKPWLLEMFDQIRFYHVEEDKLNELRNSFENGTFTPKIHEEIFDVRSYSQFLDSIQSEVLCYQKQQRESAQVQNKAERQSQLNLKSMTAEEAGDDANDTGDDANDTGDDANDTGDDANEIVLPAGSVGVEAILTAKVWEINVSVGDTVSLGDTIVVLEAMKMEFDVEAPSDGKIVQILVSSGSVVNMGSLLVVIETDGFAAVEKDLNQNDKKTRHSLKVSELLSAYRSGSAKPVQVVQQIFQDIEAFGVDKGNIWIQLGDKEHVLTAASALESRPFSSCPLYGIPFVTKDNYDVVGWTTTAGCPDYAYVPERSAHCIDKLLSAGAILIGKANMDQFATGLVGTRSPYGACANSYNSAYISGGSSSGSAVAVSLGFCSFSLGTDTAGSGRIPAAFNNIVGLKPSRGRISCHGVVPACKSLDCCSIFALTCGDAACVIQVMEGEDVKDEYSRPVAAETPLLKTFRYGVPRADQLVFFGNSDGPRLLEKACEYVDECGGIRMEIDFAPFREAADLLYEGPWVAERLVAIEDIMKKQPSSLHEITRKIIGKGANYSAVDTFRALYKLEGIKKTVARTWDEIDFLVTPTAGKIYAIAEVNSDPVQLNTNLGYYTNFMNLLDMTALALPAGFDQFGLPFGITVSAPAFSDASLLDLGRRFQEQTNLPLGKVEETLLSGKHPLV